MILIKGDFFAELMIGPRERVSEKLVKQKYDKFMEDAEKREEKIYDETNRKKSAFYKSEKLDELKEDIEEKNKAYLYCSSPRNILLRNIIVDLNSNENEEKNNDENREVNDEFFDTIKQVERQEPDIKGQPLLRKTIRDGEGLETPELSIIELKKFDFSIQDIAVRDYPTDNQNELTSEKSKPYFLTIHKVNGKEYTLSYGLESTGTHNFIKNYIYLFDAMQNGKFVVIDEFENSYHPELQEELLRQLLDNSRNNSGFQFFLTTHNTHFMSPDYFSKDQINFVDKDYKTQISDIYKLSDYDDISYKDDWEKFYREHFLGGVPNIE